MEGHGRPALGDLGRAFSLQDNRSAPGRQSGEGRATWGRGIFAGRISPLRKMAKFPQRMTNIFTVNSDAGEHCKLRHVQRCTRRREGTKNCLFATGSACVTGMHWK